MGVKSTSLAPAIQARLTEKTKVQKIRIKAATNQSHRGPSAWVSAPIDAKLNAAVTIQAAGRRSPRSGPIAVPDQFSLPHVIISRSKAAPGPAIDRDQILPLIGRVRYAVYSPVRSSRDL